MAQLEIQLIAVIVAIACSLPGVFLVLRKMAMMSDAITHTILLGIVLAFFLVHDLNSPLLIIGATAVGLLTVYLIERLHKTKRMSEDSAIGIVFPLLFSVAIILISRYAGSVHLDTDSVLLGELAFAPFNRMVLFGRDIGPKALYTMGVILLLNLAMTLLLFKEIKIAIFDAELAAVLGFSPVLINYLLMSSVSITTVGAFEAVGSILVIAFMIGPAISAYLLTDNLKYMLLLSAAIGSFNALLGYRIAFQFDVSIAGSMALMTGITFLLIFVFAPKRGMITIARRRRFQRQDFAQKSLLFHILNHQDSAHAQQENGIDTIYNHLNWKREAINRMMTMLKQKKYIVEDAGMYRLTESGKRYTIDSYNDIVESFKRV